MFFECLEIKSSREAPGYFIEVVTRLHLPYTVVVTLYTHVTLTSENAF